MKRPTAKRLRALVDALVRKHCDGAPPESRTKYRAQLELLARYGHLLELDDRVVVAGPQHEQPSAQLPLLLPPAGTCRPTRS